MEIEKEKRQTMTAELVEVDQSYAEDFWRLRRELFTELGEVAEKEDLSYRQKIRVKKIWTSL